jgi:hypothetical protein
MPHIQSILAAAGVKKALIFGPRAFIPTQNLYPLLISFPVVQICQ